jgi:hypothetical protein
MGQPGVDGPPWRTVPSLVSCDAIDTEQGTSPRWRPTRRNRRGASRHRWRWSLCSAAETRTAGGIRSGSLRWVRTAWMRSRCLKGKAPPGRVKPCSRIGAVSRRRRVRGVDSEVSLPCSDVTIPWSDAPRPPRSACEPLAHVADPRVGRWMSRARKVAAPESESWSPAPKVDAPCQEVVLPCSQVSLPLGSAASEQGNQAAGLVTILFSRRRAALCAAEAEGAPAGDRGFARMRAELFLTRGVALSDRKSLSRGSRGAPGRSRRSGRRRARSRPRGRRRRRP